MRKFNTVFEVIRHHGVKFCLFRIRYALRKKTGLLERKCPTGLWEEISLVNFLRPELATSASNPFEVQRANGKRFFFDGENLPRVGEENRDKVVSEAEEILRNKFNYFFGKSYSLGKEPDWFLNPATGGHVKANLHWSKTETFNPKVGDIKFIWEPSRFAWVYTLVRAFAVTGNHKYSEKFWELFESWLQANQPNMGPNFACGQECAIRLMAMCFALYGFRDAESATAKRKIKLITAIAVHAERIEKNIDFAISTRTNHSLTEAAGLYTAGMLFPEFKRANRWLKLGKKVLTREGLKQIYEDGSYIQHSMNYHRLMLQDFLWAFRLAELNNDSFCDELVSRVTKAVEFLYQMQDQSSGRVPNYGSNDGALIFPLNNCDYLDYRPVIQSCWYLLKKEKLYDSGPWDEDMIWFFGADSIKTNTVTVERKSTKFASGGYYTIRNNDSWAMIRCYDYRDRVGHVDMLHMDLWADGLNLLRDCGTYKYYAPDEPEMEKYFKSIFAHNTVIIDNCSPLKLAGRFMWVPWPKAKTIRYEKEISHTQWHGEHYAYSRSPWWTKHSRKVIAYKNKWEIVDNLESTGEHIAEIRWHLHPDAKVLCNDEHAIEIQLPGQWKLEIRDDDTIESELITGHDSGGWESLYYGVKSPIQTLSVKKKFDRVTRFKTLVYK